MPTILVIDDNRAVAPRSRCCSRCTISTRVRRSPAKGLDLLVGEQVDLVVQDMNFEADTTSGEEGEALFREIRARIPTCR
jgi:CheY-like chemotaxis protein